MTTQCMFACPLELKTEWLVLIVLKMNILTVPESESFQLLGSLVSVHEGNGLDGDGGGG